jgi:hypothetical protein
VGCGASEEVLGAEEMLEPVLSVASTARGLPAAASQKPPLAAGLLLLLLLAGAAALWWLLWWWLAVLPREGSQA